MNVLIISAHPDDVEVNCAGTAAKLIKRGDSVTLCNLCSGSLGHMVIMPAELAKIRLKENEAAAKMIGAKRLPAVSPDLELYHQDKAARDKVVDIIRRAKPDFIITHHPDDYMSDHAAVSRLVFDASFCASLPHYKTAADGIVPICPIYYMDNVGGFNFEPTEYVDIADEIETKIEMLKCHQSQLVWMKEHDKVDFTEMVRTFSRMRGLQAGVQYAEGFMQMRGWGRMTVKRLLP